MINDTQIIQNANELSVAQAGATYQWGICDGTTFTPIDGATSQNYVVTAIGSYAVDVISESCTSVATVDLEKIIIYDISGANIIEFKPNAQIDLGFLSKGLYVIKLITAKEVFTEKIFLK